MKLFCLSPYTAGALHFEPGEIEVSDEMAAFLLRDAPGSFSVDPPAAQTQAVKAYDEPPKDKSIRAARSKK
jgi:hypothetical protein